MNMRVIEAPVRTDTDNAAPCVAVVTVTYGRRWHFLSQLLAALEDEPAVLCTVVVDNASEAPVSGLTAAGKFDKRIVVVRADDNLGSAGGYKRGIEAALETNADFIYLLDDDNLPRRGAIRRLLQAFHEAGGAATTAVLSLRPDRAEYALAAARRTALRFRPNAFRGFHVAVIAKKKFDGVLGRRHATTPAAAMVPVEYAPYGGLMLHRDCIRKIGLPREDYFLYADDHEYSSRITQIGGSVLLCSDSIVDDLELSWNRLPRKHGITLFSDESDGMRVYYSVRNNVALERARVVRSRPAYLVNSGIYLFHQFLMALAVERRPGPAIHRLRLILRAFRDGWQGRLGKASDV